MEADGALEESSSAEGATEVEFLVGSCCLPHPDKLEWGGEDAHFISDVGGGAFGVADGVGGWHQTGVNPAAYARGLMEVAHAYVEGRLPDNLASKHGVPPRTCPAKGHIIDPRGAMHAAHMRTQVAGSSTCCIMQLDQSNRTLVAANLGDSGFIVLRRGVIIARSRPLQHYFDCPLQLGCFPDFVEATDTADEAELYTIDVRPGDVIVAGTDGLWDNIDDAEIVSTVGRADNPGAAAAQLAARVQRHSADPGFHSPYAREALQRGLDLPWWEKLWHSSMKDGRFQLGQLSGGKQDDITVVIARVVAAAAASPASPLEGKGGEC
ncbi:hypothetical protein FOA52_004025 [Chlamydomonas sp. UWO 241]|nr:hypothetical protein FOA52_004025 [Chlamydomonas sp. UWO 241]